MLNNVLLPNKLVFAFNSKSFEFKVHSKSALNPHANLSYEVKVTHNVTLANSTFSMQKIFVLGSIRNVMFIHDSFKNSIFELTISSFVWCCFFCCEIECKLKTDKYFTCEDCVRHFVSLKHGLYIDQVNGTPIRHESKGCSTKGKPLKENALQSGGPSLEKNL